MQCRRARYRARYGQTAARKIIRAREIYACDLGKPSFDFQADVTTTPGSVFVNDLTGDFLFPPADSVVQ